MGNLFTLGIRVSYLWSDKMMSVDIYILLSIPYNPNGGWKPVVMLDFRFNDQLSVRDHNYDIQRPYFHAQLLR